MGLNLREGESLLGVVSKNAADQVLDLIRQSRGELQVNLFYSLVRRLVVLCLEWRISHYELVAEDAQTPNVDLVVVGLVVHHLRREVVQCATESLPPVVGRMDTPPKICNLYCTLN